MIIFKFKDGSQQRLNPSKEFWETSTTKVKGKTVKLTPRDKADGIRHDLGAISFRIVKN